ncbi:MAG: GNAT family N-acetyltransferase [Gemmatimonadales bacterium]|nr:GNAT family N-acetyltransferase [Gemmatimonadales bacterium]
MKVSELTDDDRVWVKERTELLFGGDFVVSRQEVHDPHKLPGFIAVEGNERVGLATFNINGDECELVTIDSLCQFMGIGSELLDKVEETALAAGCKNIWAITTNDNLDAQRFFQKRGFVISSFRIGGMTKIRLLKPSIPRIGYYGLPIRDEIELAKPLTIRTGLGLESSDEETENSSRDGELPDSFAGLFTTGKVIGGFTSRKGAGKSV